MENTVDGMRERIASVERIVAEGSEESFNQAGHVDALLNRVDEHFKGVNARLDAIDRALDVKAGSLRGDITSVREAVRALGDEIRRRRV